MKEIQLEAVTKINRDGTVETITKTFPYGLSNKEQLGRPITKRFAQELISRQQQNQYNNSNIVGVTFDRNIILLLLSQTGCAGIRYYYGMKEDGNKTMVLCGIDSEGNDLGTRSPDRGLKGSIIFDGSPDEEGSVYAEVAGGEVISGNEGGNHDDEGKGLKK